MNQTETKLIASLQETFGTHFINKENSEGILDDLTAMLIARRSFGLFGNHPMVKLNQALDAIQQNNKA